MADFLSLRIPVILNKDLKAAFNKLKNSPVLPVKEEYGFRVDEVTGQTNFQPRLERTQLDDVVFDTLSLTRGERDAVYEAVISLVEGRLSKAGSLNPRERGKRLDALSKTQGIWSSLPESNQEETEE